MGLKCGIVGLPNVGKSTLFNALTATMHAQAANYPFCTIDPNVGRVGVPDNRLEQLAGIASSAKIIPAQLEFVDIAGLVKGCSRGEGLGNQFLGHIREVDAILHVVRCFEDGDVTHVEGGIDPLRDVEIIETELMLADMASLEKRLSHGQKRKLQEEPVALMQKALRGLQEGVPVRALQWSGEEKDLLPSLSLLTQKPVIYICNVAEEESGNRYGDALSDLTGAPAVLISAAIESEISLLNKSDQTAFLKELGWSQTGLDRVIRQGYALLDLITFFTVGPKEAHAWTLKKGSTAPVAAGVIHSDFERGFICAETITWKDYLTFQGEAGARAAGKVRQEGKQYIVCDGDVLNFRFNV